MTKPAKKTSSQGPWALTDNRAGAQVAVPQGLILRFFGDQLREALRRHQQQRAAQCPSSSVSD